MSDEATPLPDVSASGAEPAAEAAVLTEFGRVEHDGTVSVREGDAWRVVGQYPDATPDEALAYYQRKYTELAGEVTLLEQRFKRAGASAHGLKGVAGQLVSKIAGAAAVGDLASLRTRVEALSGVLAEASEQESAAAKEATAAAVAERTAIVEAAEALAARDPKTVQWKQTTSDLAELFARWQSHQNDGPKLPRNQSQELWRRFREARAQVEKQRREFFAELDEVHKDARERKTKLVERAEALAHASDDQVTAYRALLDEWKAAGRAGRKVDDALWARFKAAGDAVFQARSDRDAASAAESAPKLAEKQALLDEAAAIADIVDVADARAALTSIQRRWEEVGRVFPRESERPLEDAIRKIEQAVRAREDDEWKRSNPETKARLSDAAKQLTDVIAKLEGQLADAEAKGDARAAKRLEGELETRRTWLAVVLEES